MKKSGAAGTGKTSKKEVNNMDGRKRDVSQDQVLATLEREHVRYVNLEFTDVVGVAKCVTIPVEQFAASIASGKWFDGSSLEGFARIAESDMYLFPDISTFAILPGKVRAAQVPELYSTNEEPDGEEIVARVICDVRTPNGERFDGDPRTTLLRALEMAHEMGYKFLVAPELEFSFCVLMARLLFLYREITAATLISRPTRQLGCVVRWSMLCNIWELR